jgi:YidC/Oxa1 family membrane protein insertase
VDASIPGRPRIELTSLAPGDPPALFTPFEELGLGDLREAPFRVERPDLHTVVFERAERGLVLRKRYRFEPGSYALHLRLELENHGDQTLAPAFAVVWPARARTDLDFKDARLAVLNEGSVEREAVGASGGGFFSFLGGRDDGAPRRYGGDVDWAGLNARYFLAALMPDVPRDTTVQLVAVRKGESSWLSMSFAAHPVPPGQRAARELRGYLGPKEPELLEAAGARLDRAIDLGYGWVAPLTRFFAWLLDAFYRVIPNYGVAIILVTVLMRVVTAPLMARQMRSMKKLGELQPQMRALQERFKDDRQKQSEEMMKLYRTAGVNPLGGCLPMLLQMPAFIGLFYALQGSMHLRQEPFFAWITDLAAPESLFMIPGLGIPVRLLPILMGASMVLQQKMTPTSVDPAQARMMMTVMPVMFTVLFYQFPSGLVLYWLLSNLLGIVHQLWMNRARTVPGT